MTLYFISGAEGAGKSTIMPLLKKELPGFDIHDFDEGGVPLNPPLSWRHKTTKQWIKIAEDNERKEIDTLIIGLSFPSEVKKFTRRKNIKFCLLDISEKERTRRLSKRNASEEVIKDVNQLKDLRKEFQNSKNKIIGTTTKKPKEVVKEIVEWIKQT